jgi:kinetochore protein NDC80
MRGDRTATKRRWRRREYSELWLTSLDGSLRGSRADLRYGELRHKTTQLQDAMIQELTRHIDVIIKAKEHTANSLKGLRSFAESH